MLSLCAPQAYILQAQHLLRYPSLTNRTLALGEIPEQEREWMRPFRELQPECGLLEQLNSIIPCLPPKERLPAALELIHTWFQGEQGEEQLPSNGDSTA